MYGLRKRDESALELSNMLEKQPSRTALGAAAHRAVHQKRDEGRIFKDPLAQLILGPDADAIIKELAPGAVMDTLCMFIAARSRFAEDCLSHAISRRVGQLVILGAGLDTLSLRKPHEKAGLLTFEVDHPATQAWKRRRLTEVGLVPPASLTFVPVNLEEQSLPAELKAAGLDSNRSTFFHWLGVAPYLRVGLVIETLEFIAGIPGAEVVFDYTEPLENYAPERRASIIAVQSRAEEVGEPWLSFFDPCEIHSKINELGLRVIEDLGLREIRLRYLGSQDTYFGAGPHVIHAARPE